jgi:eukaryotic-like serine/threonine-protein kinase
LTRSAEVDDGGHERPAPSLLGEWLHGRYEVVAELGWGSLGHVYSAVDHVRDARVAVKVVRRDRASPKSTAYLRREFRALARLVHPGVVRVHDLDVVPGRGEPFFTLELLDGEPIVAATQARGWEAGLELFVQALRALHHVHARGLVHMDLKPQNLLVTAGGVKLIDFHLVRERSDPDDRTMRGTIAYMPPEVIKGEPVDARADLYSLGAVLYHALAGAPPFAGLPAMEMLRAHTREAPPPLAGKAPPALEAVVARLLEKSPDARFQAANDVIRALPSAGRSRWRRATRWRSRSAGPTSSAGRRSSTASSGWAGPSPRGSPARASPSSRASRGSAAAGS